MGGSLHQQALVPVGVQRVGELLEATVVCGAGAGPPANRGCHRFDPLQRRREKKGRRDEVQICEGRAFFFKVCTYNKEFTGVVSNYHIIIYYHIITDKHILCILLC